jgi:hypothetical protein
MHYQSENAQDNGSGIPIPRTAWAALGGASPTTGVSASPSGMTRGDDTRGHAGSHVGRSPDLYLVT